jgi:hypothetical protein
MIERTSSLNRWRSGANDLQNRPDLTRFEVITGIETLADGVARSLWTGGTDAASGAGSPPARAPTRRGREMILDRNGPIPRRLGS